MGNYKLHEYNGSSEITAYSDFIKKLLTLRGVTTNEEAESFINPDFQKGMYDPFLLPDMRKAAERIHSAIKNNEKIAIYSDYDADGIPGGAMMYDFLKKVGYQNFINYIPHRHEEGYGMNNGAVEKLAKDGVSLIITIDCGITDNDQVALAESLGMHVIVTDHHLPGATLPPAFAVVNPKRGDSIYPDKMICGSGVAFKLVQAVLALDRLGLKDGAEKWLLDLVGMATISDMVPLLDENRIFAYYGLMVLRKSPRVGLLKLFRDLRINQRYITEDDIAFSITPRINAASRMDRPEEAFRLLVTESEEEAGLLVKHLNKINNERKGVVASISKEVKKILKERADVYEGRNIIVIGNPAWKPALLGLVANSIKDDDGRTVFVWGREGGEYIRGSCRSGGGISVVKLMEEAKEYFTEYGGHKMAGGFTVKEDKIHLLEEGLEHAFKKITEGEDLQSEYTMLDHQLEVGEINETLWSEISKLAPFGIGNPKPLFLLKNAEVAEVKSFGKEKNHLEIKLHNNKRKVKAIAFYKKPEDFFLDTKRFSYDVIASLEKSSFGGFTELRLRLEDIGTFDKSHA